LADGGMKGHHDLIDTLGKKTGSSPQRKVAGNEDLYPPTAPLSNNFTVDDPESKHMR